MFGNQVKELETAELATTRDMTAASGDVSYAFTTFRPRLILVNTAIVGANHGSWGYAAANLNLCISLASGNFLVTAISCIWVVPAGGAEQYAALASMNDDGITLTWTKVGLPTGTLQIQLVALR